MFCVGVFFFKRKTAYEMRISDWSSDVCSSDLITALKHREAELARRTAMLGAIGYAATSIVGHTGWQAGIQQLLNKLGEAAEVSRVSIFQIHQHPDLGWVQSCRFDWAEPGLATLSDDPVNWRSEEHTSELQSLM